MPSFVKSARAGAPSKTSAAMLASPPQGFAWGERARKIARLALFLGAIALACPIRYWPLLPSGDNTWAFAMNYAAAHGLAHGRDVVWTNGPLGYLAFPQDIGNNLAQALVFQSLVWLALIAAFADLFFVASFPLSNLAVCLFFLMASGPWYWFNTYMGVENLMLTGAMVLLVAYRWRGGLHRYIGALLLMALVPQIKLTAGMIAGGALLGFLVDRAAESPRRAFREAAWAALILGVTTAAICLAVFASLDSFVSYLRAARELIAGYTAALSLPGGAAAMLAVLVTLALIAILLSRVRTFAAARFYALFLAIPLYASFKHGFVRQGAAGPQSLHVIAFFCFAAVAMAVISLQLSWSRIRLSLALVFLLVFGFVWKYYAADPIGGLKFALPMAAGQRALALASTAVPFNRLRSELSAQSREYPATWRLEPAIRAAVGDSSVAILSEIYSGAPLDNLRLALYPVVQPNMAFTPYLDGLNAAWVRDRGPRFIVSDLSAIDGRHFWLQMPAMWLEVYRWYDAAMTGSRSILLERRTQPRFKSLQPVSHSQASLSRELLIPVSRGAVFWTMTCPLSLKGRLGNLLWRLPAVTARISETGKQRGPFRVIPPVFASPVLGNYLPNDLAELAALFRTSGEPDYSVKSLSFEGGIDSYDATCELEFLQPR